jgi:hypothetical protein
MPPADDPIAQVRAKLYRLARDRGLVPPSDASPATDPAPAAPDPTGNEPADPSGETPDDDPIAQMRAKLQRLAEARGLIPSSDAPPDAAAPSEVSGETDPDDGSRGPE